MYKELELESFNAQVLSKYAENSEKYTIEKDNVVKPNNRAWIIKYYRNLSNISIISVLVDDMPKGEQAYWNKYKLQFAD